MTKQESIEQAQELVGTWSESVTMDAQWSATDNQKLINLIAKKLLEIANKKE